MLPLRLEVCALGPGNKQQAFVQMQVCKRLAPTYSSDPAAEVSPPSRAQGWVQGSGTT